MNNDIEEILFSAQEISDRVDVLGKAITEDYRSLVDERGVVLVCILRGSLIFTADLARAIDLPVTLDFIAVSSYGDGVKSSGTVNMVKGLDTDIEGRHVILVEDILDTGLTLSRLIGLLQEKHPASLEVATLLRKDTPDQADIPCKYIGFECPDRFIVGYGLDYAQRYRNLPYVGVLNPSIYQ